MSARRGARARAGASCSRLGNAALDDRGAQTAESLRQHARILLADPEPDVRRRTEEGPGHDADALLSERTLGQGARVRCAPQAREEDRSRGGRDELELRRRAKKPVEERAVAAEDRSGTREELPAARECDRADPLGDVGTVDDAEVVDARGAMEQRGIPDRPADACLTEAVDLRERADADAA